MCFILGLLFLNRENYAEVIKKLYSNIIFHESPPKTKQQKIFVSENYADSGDKIICFLIKGAEIKGKNMVFNYICSKLIIKIQCWLN